MSAGVSRSEAEVIQMCSEPSASLYGQGSNLLSAPQLREDVGLGEKETDQPADLLGL